MCLHNSMSAKLIKLASRYSRKSTIVETHPHNLCEQDQINSWNFPKHPIITSSEEIQVFNWGLIPFWTKAKKEAKEIREMTFNAHADTIFEKSLFRESIMKRRCIVPSTGYFAWRREGNKKIPYHILLKGEEIFSMAGIFDLWLDQATGEGHSTFAIITTESNPLTSYIHNTNFRMPVILSKGDEERWLAPDLSKDEITSLLKPYCANLMKVNFVSHDRLIERNPNCPVTI